MNNHHCSFSVNFVMSQRRKTSKCELNVVATLMKRKFLCSDIYVVAFVFGEHSVVSLGIQSLPSMHVTDHYHYQSRPCHEVVMKVALTKVFPSTFHQLCKWYITNTMGNKIDNVNPNKISNEQY